MSEPRQPYGDQRRRPPAGARAETRRDVDAALAARLELGPEYEDHIAAGLAERVEELVAYRTAELRTTRDVGSAELELERSSRRQRFVLGIISLGTGIPITAIAGEVVEPGLLGVAIAWAGIVGVNVVHARNRKH
jgi:hypothetical protein